MICLILFILMFGLYLIFDWDNFNIAKKIFGFACVEIVIESILALIYS